MSDENRMRGVPAMKRTEGEPADIAVDAIQAFTAAVFTAAGMRPEDAATVAENFLWADSRGVDTHGVQRIPWYLGWFEQGITDPAATLEILRDRPAHSARRGVSDVAQPTANGGIIPFPVHT